LKNIPKFKHLNLYKKAVVNTIWAEWLKIKVCNKILCNDINWILISPQVQGLNIPMRRGTMADIHESESSSLNESSSTTQGVEQDERRYGWLHFLKWQRFLKFLIVWSGKCHKTVLFPQRLFNQSLWTGHP
jgi:hypothetical protein